MDTPIEEQQMFQNVTCNIAASEHEITEPNTLSVDFINYVSDAWFYKFLKVVIALLQTKREINMIYCAG